VKEIAKYSIIGTQTCGYCDRAKKLLESKGIEYRYTNLTELSQMQKEDLMNIAGRKFETVPQIFQSSHRGLEYVGGYTELEIKINNEGLEL
tara:strand:- start:115 stop:387 length:273 start_codon:yes stop_codon:yes gene_type:complete